MAIMTSTGKSRESAPKRDPSAQLVRAPRKQDANPRSQVSTPKGKSSTIKRLKKLGLVGNGKNNVLVDGIVPSGSQSRLDAAEDVPEPVPSIRRPPPGIAEPIPSSSLEQAIEDSLQNIPIAVKAEGSPKLPEPTFLAKKIQALLDALPSLSQASRFLSKDAPTTATTILDSDGCPIPPPGATRIADPELISLLSSPSIMNGSEGRRQSVWSMLEAIRPPSVQSFSASDEYAEYAGSDRSSVMMYSPLIPTADSIVELAESEAVPLVAEGTSSPGRLWSYTLWPYVTWPDVWPFNGWKAKVSEAQTDVIPGQSLVPDPEPQNNPGEHGREVPVHRVWVPSTTQLSFETTWWGYRIYIPPPVLAILDDQSVEAAKQATTITAALTWFFSNLPISAFPPPVQPAMILLQRLVPFVSYIGTFISWSWSTIRGFDQGHGVILRVTWLLPIALIPGTWTARDVPPPSSAPTPPSSDAVSISTVVPELPVSLAADVPEPQPLLLAPPTPPVSAPLSSASVNTRPPAIERTKSKTMSTLRKLKRTLT
ncbi:hypothetical protein B0H10DRAFT_1946134 [Mycena sp. CBHHK59/15]|nr:hypothetical protein B0H10DRAFT_1946134 [Mycena sp. CBHHK59/15]